jgi:hypothetical protein
MALMALVALLALMALVALMALMALIALGTRKAETEFCSIWIVKGIMILIVIEIIELR